MANSKAEFASDSPSLDADELAAAVESDGASKWLDGLQFVVSGVFENIARDTLETFICDHGGRRTTAVSGKTDYLIIGSRMEDGRDIEFGGKYKKAQKCGTSILTEDKFEELV
jgi:NAD-dependent DNA ligase